MSRKTPENYIAEAETLAVAFAESPGKAFAEFYEDHARLIGDTILALKKADTRMNRAALRAGLMPPGDSLIAERLKLFCRIPYRTPSGIIDSCPGILRGWKGCPPYAPAARQTIALLGKARGFLIVQFEGNEDGIRQSHIHPFIARAAGTLRETGYAVLGTYASGPCRVCPQGCSEGKECRQPDRRLFALEACGFWVNSLCRRAARFPIGADGPLEVCWIRDWGLDTQDTRSVRYVTGILLG